MPKGVPLTRVTHDIRRQEIVRAAAGLVRDKGPAAPSMRRIAEAAGIGKSTLYDYFPGRDDILAAIEEEGLARLVRQARDIAALDLPAPERLARILRGRLAAGLAGRDPASPLDSPGRRLSAGARRRLRTLAAEYQDTVAEVISRGCQDGLFRPVEPAAAARAVLGATAPPDEDGAAGAVDETAGRVALDIVLRGLAAEAAGREAA